MHDILLRMTRGEAVAGEAVDLRVGLFSGDVVAGDDGVEPGELEAGALDYRELLFFAAGGGDGELDGAGGAGGDD